MMSKNKQHSADQNVKANLDKLLATWSTELIKITGEPWLVSASPRDSNWQEGLVQANGELHVLSILLTMLPNVKSVTF